MCTTCMSTSGNQEKSNAFLPSNSLPTVSFTFATKDNDKLGTEGRGVANTHTHTHSLSTLTQAKGKGEEKYKQVMVGVGVPHATKVALMDP